jgi:hypothetical protein
MSTKVTVGTRLYKVYCTPCAEDLHIDVEEYEVIHTSPFEYACRGLEGKASLGFITVSVYAVGEQATTHLHGPYGLSRAEAIDLHRKKLDYDIDRQSNEVDRLKRKLDALVANTFDLVYGGQDYVCIDGGRGDEDED